MNLMKEIQDNNKRMAARRRSIEDTQIESMRQQNTHTMISKVEQERLQVSQCQGSDCWVKNI